MIWLIVGAVWVSAMLIFLAGWMFGSMVAAGRIADERDLVAGWAEPDD